MKAEQYADLMNYIAIINERYNTLRFGVTTNSLNANNNLIINYPNDNYIDPFVITGITTILNADMAIENLNDGALYVAGGVNIKKNLFIGYDIVNKYSSLSTSFNINTEKLKIEEHLYSNIVKLEQLYCENINLNNYESNFIMGNEVILTSIENIKFEPNTGEILNEHFIINNLFVQDNSEILIIGSSNSNNISGNIDGANNIICNNIISNQTNPNNLIATSDVLIKYNLQAKTANIKGIFKLNKTLASSKINNLTISGELVQTKSGTSGNTEFDKDLNVQNVHNDGNIYCKELYVKFTEDTPLRTVPLYDVNNEITEITYFFQASETYCAFTVFNNIIFVNPGNFNMLTLKFDAFNPDLLLCKPNYGFYILVGGLRSSINNTYFIIYKINFFDYNSSQINITVHYDSNNELKFVSGFRYTIYKFNCNYLI